MSFDRSLQFIRLSLILVTFALGVGSATANTDTDLSERQKAEYDYAYTLGVQAVVYGWAPVMMDVARVLQTSVQAPTNNGQAPLNELGPITRLWDHRDQSYATPNNDGSLTVFISKDMPSDAKRLANWLPAPDGNFMLQIRLYEPLDSVVSGDFELPQLNKIEH